MMVAPVLEVPVFVPPVLPEMAPPVLVEEANFDEEVAMDFSPPFELKKGHLKLRLNRAHIRFHEGPEFERMSPFVKINIEDFEWRSVEKEGEGKNPEWGPLAVMEVDIVNPEAIMRIEVKDHQGLLDNSPLGWCEVPAHFFAREGGRTEWLSLNIDGVEAGRIHFCSEFHADILMAPPIIEAPVVDMMVADAMMGDGGRPGFLKMHLKHARLERHVGPEFERMSPHVIIKMDDFEWRSEDAFEGGKEPNWNEQELRMEVFDHRREMHIKVKNGEEQIGHVKIDVGFFAKAGRWSDSMELMHEGMPVGRIHFKTHFHHN
jgi:Ca2+-dependent lipid-binding protein